MSETENSTQSISDSSEETDDLPIPEEDDSAPPATSASASPPSSEEPLRMAPDEEDKDEGLYTIEEEQEEYYSDAEVSTPTSTTEATATEGSTSSAPPTSSRGSPTITLGVEESSDTEASDSTTSSPTEAIQDLHFWLEVFRVARWPILILLVIILLGVWILGGCAILVFGKPCLETRSPMTSRMSQTNPSSSTASSTFYARVPISDPSIPDSEATSTATPVHTSAAASTTSIRPPPQTPPL